jgi:hypothetical protein
MAATITLTEGRSHSVRIGATEYRFEAGKPLITSDQELVRYCQSRPQGVFAVAIMAPPKAAIEAPTEEEAEVEAEPSPVLKRGKKGARRVVVTDE